MKYTSLSYHFKKHFVKFLPVFISLLLIFFPFTLIYAEMLSVKGNNVNMRSGPGKKYTILWEYGSGFPLKVITKKGKWVNVEDFEKDTGWIHQSLLIKKPQMIVKVSPSAKINIRSGPGIQYKRIGEAHYGVVFESLSKKSGWVKVKHETGLIGWVKRNLLWGY